MNLDWPSSSCAGPDGLGERQPLHNHLFATNRPDLARKKYDRTESGCFKAGNSGQAAIRISKSFDGGNPYIALTAFQINLLAGIMMFYKC
jgi:hypothetical protein